MLAIKSVYSILRSYRKTSHLHDFPTIVNLMKNSIKTKQLAFTSSIAGDNNEAILEELCKGNVELEKKLKLVMLEVEVMRQNGYDVPNILNLRDWKVLIDLPSKNKRNKFLSFIFKKEKQRENDKIKKEDKKSTIIADPNETKEFPDDLLYGLSYQSMFLRIRDTSIGNSDNYRALQSLVFGQNLVIDCSYEGFMDIKEKRNAANQIMYTFGENRIHRNPFNLHLCNVKTDGIFMEQLSMNLPQLQDLNSPINIHSESFLDIFPKNNLVYMTPYCSKELTHYDPNMIYIVGCMVNKREATPYSLSKAKSLGLKMAKLPLDRYIKWAPGAKKSLNINHMVAILSDLQTSQDWEYVLRHVPRRKLMSSKFESMKKKAFLTHNLPRDLWDDNK